MSFNPFFSIVMPVYGVEKHLKNAVDSVLNQTNQDFEMILVDDCSPDNSPQICDFYTKQDDRIKVIHHERNKGLSEARNSGLAEAAGEYIWFMDSDDYVDENLLEKVKESLDKNPAEMVAFGLVEEYYDENNVLKHTKKVSMDEHLINNPDDVHQLLIKMEEATLYGYAWNKFYKLSYLKEIGLKYETITLIEDIVFNVKFCMNLCSMNLLSITPYHYGKRIDNSLTSKFVKDYFALHQKRVKIIYDQYQYWGCCTEAVKQKLGSIYARYILSALQRNCDKRAGYNFVKRYRWTRDLFTESFFLELKDYMQPRSKSMRILMPLIKNRCTLLCMMVGRVIYIVKSKLPILFAKAKESK